MAHVLESRVRGFRLAAFAFAVVVSAIACVTFDTGLDFAFAAAAMSVIGWVGFGCPEAANTAALASGDPAALMTFDEAMLSMSLVGCVVISVPMVRCYLLDRVTRLDLVAAAAGGILAGATLVGAMLYRPPDSPRGEWFDVSIPAYLQF